MRRTKMPYHSASGLFHHPQNIAAFDAVVVVLFSSGKLVLVRSERRAWEFPREAREEAPAEIAYILYLGYDTGRPAISP